MKYKKGEKDNGKQSDDGKFMLSNLYKLLSFIEKGEIVRFLKLIIYLSISFDERQKGMDIYKLT